MTVMYFGEVGCRRSVMRRDIAVYYGLPLSAVDFHECDESEVATEMRRIPGSKYRTQISWADYRKFGSRP